MAENCLILINGDMGQLTGLSFISLVYSANVYVYQVITLITMIVLSVAESAGSVTVVGRVPATGCASGDIMWLLDEPNQPYEGNYYIISILLTHPLHLQHLT